MPENLILGAIGDDLTGSVELAGMLAAGGARVSFYTDPAAFDPSATDDAAVIAQRSRVAPVAEAKAAFERCAQVLLKAGAKQLFYKYCATFDSTPEGNIGPCTDVLADRIGDGSALFCPAFPEVDRTVYRGHLYVGDQLVSNSPKRFDPLTPMTEPDLVKVLQPQTKRRVGMIPWHVVAAGPDAIRAKAKALRDAGVPYAIIDTVAESDLVHIARATWDWPLMTGGSSVAAYYPGIWREHGLTAARPPQTLPATEGPAAVLAGSCAERTREQVAHFGQRHPVLAIDLTENAAVEAVVQRSLDWAQQRLGREPVTVTTALDQKTVDAAQAALGKDGAARRAEAILGQIAKGLAERGMRRLVVAGGETSGAVIEALGIRRLTVAPYTTPGIGLCAVDGPRPLTLCLKSGKLGNVDLFETALERMRH